MAEESPQGIFAITVKKAKQARLSKFETPEDTKQGFYEIAKRRGFTKEETAQGEQLLRVFYQLKKKLPPKARASLEARKKNLICALQLTGINPVEKGDRIAFCNYDLPLPPVPASPVDNDEMLSLIQARMEALGLQPRVIAPAMALASAPQAPALPESPSAASLVTTPTP